MLEQRRLPAARPAAPVEPLALSPFLNLAREVSALFVPPHMRPEFRAALERSLLIAARRQTAHDILYQDPGQPAAGRLEGVTFDRRWVVGAALGSAAVSIVSIVALVWHHRSKAA